MLPERAAEPGFPIVDPHQHFWNLDRNYHPWLCDPAPIAFRYGDYSAIRRNYLPVDYRRDTARYRIVKTVHIEAEWDRADPVGETRWIEAVHGEFGLPSASIAHAQPDRPDVEQILAGHAQSPLVRGIRHKPKASSHLRDAGRGASGSMDDPRWRAGFSLLERFGFSYDLQTPWWHLDAAAELAADFPATQIILNHTWSIDLGEPWHLGRPVYVNVIAVLVGIGALGYGLALRQFCRRDLPAPL